MYRALRAGQLDEGRRLQHALMPVIHALFAEPNPSVVKLAMADQGLLLNALRPPMCPASDKAAHLWRSLRHQLRLTPEPASLNVDTTSANATA